MFPLYFPHWFPDTWVDHVARMAGRHAKLPIVMYPIRGKGRTKLMRNLPFWTRFFQLTLPEREEAARKLIATINPSDKAAALVALRQVTDQLPRTVIVSRMSIARFKRNATPSWTLRSARSSTRSTSSMRLPPSPGLSKWLANSSRRRSFPKPWNASMPPSFPTFV